MGVAGGRCAGADGVAQQGRQIGGTVIGAGADRTGVPGGEAVTFEHEKTLRWETREGRLSRLVALTAAFAFANHLARVGRLAWVSTQLEMQIGF
jgi:hypothetical protein